MLNRGLCTYMYIHKESEDNKNNSLPKSLHTVRGKKGHTEIILHFMCLDFVAVCQKTQNE